MPRTSAGIRSPSGLLGLPVLVVLFAAAPAPAVAAEGSDRCEPDEATLQRAASAVLAGSRSPAAASRRWAAWDRRTPPAGWPRIAGRFHLTPAERGLLHRNGFAVSARLETTSYATALQEVHRSELPVYVSADALMTAHFRSHETLMERLEERLAPLTAQVIDRLHAALPGRAAGYPDEVAGDLDLYLTVARRLLSDRPVPPMLERAGDPAALVTLAQEARGLSYLELFGRRRVVDFSQYRPRGHYASSKEQQRYFRGAMWLSRLELNLVSRASRSSAPDRADPRPTPREALMALALADLVEQSGQQRQVAALDRAWSLLAGPREDVSVAELSALRRQAGITSLRQPDAFVRLEAAIGDRFQRTTRLHVMPPRSMPLPAIATLLGPRIVPDATALMSLVHPAVVGRYQVGVADVAALLGHRRAVHHLGADLERFPGLGSALARERARLAARFTDAARPAVLPGADLYGAWLSALRALAVDPAGARPGRVLPSFMGTPAFADLRMSSLASAYGQLRRNHVLVAGQTYDEGGCRIPDGFVEPVPGLLSALLASNERVQAALGELGPVLGDAGGLDWKAEQEHARRQQRVLRVLATIVEDELAGRPLSAEARRFLALIVEIRPPGSGGPARYNGWYFTLHGRAPRSKMHREPPAAVRAGAVLGDFFTSVNTGQVTYAGAGSPRLGFFVVDTGGPARLMVGPVARGFQVSASLERRLSEAEAGSLRSVVEPWTRSYTGPQPPEPPLSLSVVDRRDGDEQAGVLRRFSLRSTRPLGVVTVELLDHHRVPVARGQLRVDATPRALVVRLLPGRKEPTEDIEGMMIQVGAFSRLLVPEYPVRPEPWNLGELTLGGMRPAQRVVWGGGG